MEVAGGIIAGLVVGGVIAWLVASTREREGRVRAETQLLGSQKTLEEQKKLLEQASTQFSDTFKALAGDALRSNNQAFLELARQSLDTILARTKGDLSEKQEAIKGLVTPLQEALKGYEEHIKALEESRQKAFGGLEEQLRTLAGTNQQLQRETSNLVGALRTPQVRGRWGELTLRRAVELAGMVPYCDFNEQVSTPGETGQLRPDMIVHLPSERQIIVDAKVALDAYLTAIEAVDEEERQRALSQHVRQIRTHMNALATKSYWDQFPQTPEFVVMFIPGEAFLAAAALHDPSLLEEGLEKKVIIATPSTLIALLRAIAYGWRQEQLAQNAQAISELGKQLYERMKILTEHLNGIGSSLDRTLRAYNNAVGSFETRVLPSARRFRELGAATGEEIATLEPVTSAPRALKEPESDDGRA